MASFFRQISLPTPREVRETIRQTLVRSLVGGEYIKFTGVVCARELPSGITLPEFLAWWPHLSEKERDRYTAARHENALMASGRAQLLTFASSNNAVVGAFAQYFSVGTSPLTSVSPGDAAVQGEIFRAAPTAVTITGQQVNVSTYFGPSQANGNYSNAGLYGSNATATLGSGTLMTHTLYSYNKTNGQAITNDYLLNLQ